MRKTVGLFLSTLLLAVLFAPLCSIPLLSLAKHNDRGFYATGFLVFFLLFGLSHLTGYFLWAPFLSVALLVFLFHSFRVNGFNLFSSGALSVFGVLGVISLGLYFWLTYQNLSFLPWISGSLETFSLEHQEAFISLLPAIVTTMLIVSLWIGLSYNNYRSLAMAFKVPDICIFILGLSIGLAFIDHGLDWVKVFGLNIFVIMIVVYFLLGTSVITMIFNLNKVGFLWQLLICLLLVLYAPWAILLLGVFDYWLDLRTKTITRMAEKNTKG